MLTSKERSFLRSLANTLDPIFQVGKEGVHEDNLKEISDALEARELIKISVLKNCLMDAREACHEICDAIGADPVQVIGSKFVIYRKSKEKSKIELPKAKKRRDA
ncbi:ribosome assembly RNA-binding protein YhbY [Clostridium cylindrosporum]|uniref:RNA-binding, CRM domain-containing protein n=1 Tax=Clostridium cylindrosporum DSM 605 TaxID=1121307 RepID=A0A0J8DB76_CLOCY|nr:ribosome assembly RNA-binding protein YhbY [Clostridium cylindrosporum]KMT21554.1 RNA-binding, CRM domain-containing protein [Clostridium cylindrosporum DSM 605]